jgi:hypothetical protein
LSIYRREMNSGLIIIEIKLFSVNLVHINIIKN